MTVKEIPIENLQENDYNPRKRFDDAAMEDLKNSIQNVGLVQPPTARPLDNGDYEVISGVRRLRALRDVYEGDHEVPVYIREVDDEEARWMALAENLDRMDLTPIEEARAYAQHVTISVDGEEMPYDEYIKVADVDDVHIEVPTHNHDSVEKLGQKINPGPDVINHRLLLLALPESVQNRVENGNIRLRAAETIARLRQIPDAGYRTEQMERLAEQYSGSSPDVGQLRDSVDGIIDSFQEEQDQKEARIEQLEELVDEREGQLRVELEKSSETYQESTGDTLEVENGDELFELAESAVEQLGDRIDSLGTSRIDFLDDQQASIQKERDRLERNLKVVKEEGLDRCPFCRAGVHAVTLEGKIEEKEAEIQSIRGEKGDINDQREILRDIRSDLRQALTYYTDAIEELEAVREEVAADG